MPKPLRVFAYILAGILSLLLLIIVLIQVPAIQTFITGKVTQNFEEQWGTRVEIGKVNLTFFETATIEDIYIEDQSGDTLLYAEYLKADIGLFALFDQTLVLDEIALKNAYINLFRPADGAKFNYEFIVESFASKDTTQTEADTTSGGFTFDLAQLRLEQVRFNYIDDSSQMDFRAVVPFWLTEIETLGLEEEHIQINNIDIRELDVLFAQAPATPGATPADTAAGPEEPIELDSAWLNPSGFRYSLQKLSIENSHIRYKADEETEGRQLNFGNLELTRLGLQLEDFYLAGDTLRAQLQALNFREEMSGFTLEDLAFKVKVEESIVAASLQKLITPHSRLEEEFIVERFDLATGDDMLAQLRASAQIDGAVIGLQDATYFTDALDTLPGLREQDIRLSLNMEIADNKAAVDLLELRSGDGFYLLATARANSLDQPEQMRFDVQLRELRTSIAYMEALNLIEDLPPGARQSGTITLIAQAKGTLYDATLVARAQSGVGRLETNLLYKAPTKNSFLLAGNIDAKNFNLHPFTGDSSGLGSLSMSSNIRVRGRGEAIDVPKFSLLVSKLEFNDYTYEGLAAEGHFIDSTFELATAYEDSFLKFDILAKSDLKDSLPLLMAEVNLSKANLLRLNLMEDSIIVSTTLSAQVQGQTPDEIVGLLEMQETEIIRGPNSYTMDSLKLTSTMQENGQRAIVLLTDFMSAKLSGSYLFEQLPLAIEQCANYYCSAYKPTEGMLAQNQEIELELEITDEPVIAKAFVPNLELTYPLRMVASLDSDRRSFHLDLSAPGLIYDSIAIENLVASVETVDRVMSYEMEADYIRAGEVVDIPYFGLEGKWAQDSVHFDLALGTPSDSSHLALGGAVTFPGDTIVLALDNTDLSIYGQDYMLTDNAIFKSAGNYLYIDNFVLQSNEQRLAIYTRDAETTQPKLVAEIHQFQVADFMLLAGLEEYNLAAEINGDVILTDLADLPAIEADLAIQNILVDSIHTGDLQIKLNKVAGNGRLNTDITLEGPGNQLALTGYYNLEDTTDAISLDLTIEQLALNPWEPFVQEFITGLSGSLEGEIAVQGSAGTPVVEGSINFRQEAAFRLVATGARYQLSNETVTLDTEQIRFNQLTLTDSLKQDLVVGGSISHQYFKDFVLDLTVNASDFQVINKARSLREPFYGTLYVATNLEITGPLEDVVVEGSLKVNDKTDFVIVQLEEEASAISAEFITFVNHHAFLQQDTATAPSDKLTRQERLVDVGGFTLNVKVEVTPASQYTVIIDPATGDNLTISGEADLRVRMDPLQGMNMQGVFTVADGRYRLSFLEVIQKNFDIEKGSTVEFDGDPLKARLNLTAIYTTETSRFPLVEDQVEFMTSQEISAAKRREPVSVLLSMVGTIVDPEFTFDIVVPETGYSMSSTVAQQLQDIKRDQTKLFKQVFGLIVLNRFIRAQPSLGGGGGGPQQAINARVDQSLSAFLTEQLNAVAQDYLGVSIEVDVDSRQPMEGEDASYAAKDVDLELGKSFFNERLEVKVGGTTSVGETGGTTVASGDSEGQIAGNFTILYHINERGNLNLKIFRRNERNLFTNEFIPQTGISLSYTKSFEDWENFIGREDPRRQQLLKSDGVIKVDKEEPEEEEQEEPEQK